MYLLKTKARFRGRAARSFDIALIINRQCFRCARALLETNAFLDNGINLFLYIILIKRNVYWFEEVF